MTIHRHPRHPKRRRVRKHYPLRQPTRHTWCVRRVGLNPCLRKDSATTTIHERHGIYYADLYRPDAHTVASIYTITGEEVNTSISYDSEDNESHEECSSRTDEEVSNNSNEPQEDEAILIASHTETETPRNRDQWDYYNGQPMSAENAEYMQQTM